MPAKSQLVLYGLVQALVKAEFITTESRGILQRQADCTRFWRSVYTLCIASISHIPWPDKKPLKFHNTLDEMGIEKSMFILPNSLHLTVVMLKLKNKEAVDAAQDILKSVSASVRHALNNRPVFIRLKGLECMNGYLDKTRVLYAPVEEVGGEGRLLRACNIIIDAFVNVGFAGKDAMSRLKLHVTMMNATYRRDKSKGMTFDAREIYKVFGRKDWGEYLIREAQISKRFWYDSNGYFHCCGSLPFPN